MTDTWQNEVQAGQRFAFGRNWRHFLEHLDEDRIHLAESSLCGLLGAGDLTGKRFLDIGSGSGLFSLAARRMGAEVTSFDFDPDSVACAQGLRRRFRPNDPAWTVLQGSALDRSFLEGLGSFDVVYSWGVLHHTGDQWTALSLACQAVAPGGILAVALYNHQPFFTPLHKRVKRLYARSGRVGRFLVSMSYALGVGLALALADILRGRNPLVRHTSTGRPRGMRFWHDVVDWVGGWPFETSRPEEVFRFCKARDLVLTELSTVGGKSGCNEFVFFRPAASAPGTHTAPCASS